MKPERLKTAMTQRAISQSDLAHQAGVTPSAVNQILAGKRMPSVQTAIWISRVLGVSIDWLCGEDDSRLDVGQRRLFNRIERLSDANRELVEDVVELFLRKQEGEKSNG